MTPSRNALVVRGGVKRDPEVLAADIERNVNHGQPAALSVWSLDAQRGEEREATLTRIVEQARIPHSKLQVSSHDKLIDAGFVLALDTSNGQAACHYNVAVSFPVNNAELQRFIDCFSEPEDRPR